jgi:endonuclease YncB( thermonuclease family)
MMKSLWLGVALAILWAGSAAAAVIDGTVVRVVDGDTITVLDGGKTQHKIRLGGIDAPERRQPFTERSKQLLSDLVFGKTVAVHWDKRDRYGRIVGRVMVADPACTKDCTPTVDAGLALVRAGYAWWYRQYAREQPPTERVRYEAAENEARAGKRGLWVEEKPTPPWEFRRNRKKKSR